MTHTPSTVAPFLSLTLLTGCASLPAASSIKSEARSGNGLLTSRPRVFRTDNGLLVSGYVTRGSSYFGSDRMHLDFERLSPDGRRLALVPTRFFPKPIPHRSRFPSGVPYIKRLPYDFPLGSGVRLTPHPATLTECLASLTTQQ